MNKSYKALLHEHLIKVGSGLPEYNTRQLGLTPSSFRSEFKFNGKTFEGRGINKKSAEQDLAKNMLTEIQKSMNRAHITPKSSLIILIDLESNQLIVSQIAHVRVPILVFATADCGAWKHVPSATNIRKVRVNSTRRDGSDVALLITLGAIYTKYDEFILVSRDKFIYPAMDFLKQLRKKSYVFNNSEELINYVRSR